MDVRKLGAKIRELRKQKGLTQEQLAEGVCSIPYLSIIERGVYEGEISVEKLNAMSLKLGATLQELMIEVENDGLETEMLVDLVKVSVLRSEYDFAINLVKQLRKRDNLLQHQQEQITLYYAESLIKIGDTRAAIDILTDFNKSLEASQSTDQYLFATISNSLGSAYFNLHDVITAHAHYTRAHQISTLFSKQDLLCARISYNLGITCQSLRMDLQARLHLENALRLYEKLGERTRMANSLYWLGITLKHLGEIKRAGEYIRQSLSLYEAENISKMVQVTKSLYAYHFIAPQNNEQGITELQKSITEYEKMGELSPVLFNTARIADLYLDQGAITKAVGTIETAFSRLSSVNDLVVTAYLYRVYSRVLAADNRLDESIEHSYKSAELCDKMGLAKEKANSLRQAVHVLQLQGKVEDALNLSIKVSETLYNALDFQVIS